MHIDETWIPNTRNEVRNSGCVFVLSFISFLFCRRAKIANRCCFEGTLGLSTFGFVGFSFSAAPYHFTISNLHPLTKAQNSEKITQGTHQINKKGPSALKPMRASKTLTTEMQKGPKISESQESIVKGERRILFRGKTFLFFFFWDLFTFRPRDPGAGS